MGVLPVALPAALKHWKELKAMTSTKWIQKLDLMSSWCTHWLLRIETPHPSRWLS